MAETRRTSSSRSGVLLLTTGLAVLLLAGGGLVPVGASHATPPSLGSLDTQRSAPHPSARGIAPPAPFVPPSWPHPVLAKVPHREGPRPAFGGTSIIYIYPNGTVSNGSAPISVSGATYSLTGNLTDPIFDERNGSTLNGAGHTIHVNTTLNTFGLVLSGVSQVTAENLNIAEGLVLVDNSQSVTLLRVNNPSGTNVSEDLWIQLSTGVLVENCRLLERSMHVNDLAGVPVPITPPRSLQGAAIGVEASATISVVNSYASGLVGIWATVVTDLLLQNDSLNATVQGFVLSNMPVTVVAGADLSIITGLIATLDNFTAPALNGSGTYLVLGAVAVGFSTNGLLERSRWLGPEPVGLYLASCSNFTIAFNDGDGINGVSFLISNSDHLLLQSNNASSAPLGADAFELSNILVATLLANNASNTGTAVYLLSSYEVRILNNSFPFDTGQAVSLTSDDLCAVTGNDLTGSSALNADGIFVNNSTRLAIANNSIGAWSGLGSEAVDALDLRDSSLAYNIASGAPIGIELVGSFDDTLRGNLIQSGGSAVGDAAILLRDSASLTLVHNTLLFDRTGILATGGGDSLILANNLSFDTAQGVRWSAFNNLTFAHNTIVDDGAGIDLVDGAHYSIVDNTASNLAFACGTCDGLFLQQLSDGTITGNNLSSVNLGVYGSYLLNLSIRSNTAYQAGFAVLVGDVTNLTVADNKGGNDLGGIEVDSSQNVLLLNNSFSTSVAEGFELIGVVNVTLDGNTAASSGGDGIALWSATGATLRNNTLVGDKVGLRLENSSAVTVEANVLGNCTVSFRLNTVVNATFFHNNFELNANWTLIGNTSGLRWESGYPIGGNFWSNATGTDAKSGPGQNVQGADGILDQPFPVRGFGADRYPLAVPWASPSVQFLAQGLPPGTPWTVSFAYGGLASGTATLVGTGSTGTSLSIPYGAWVPFTYRIGYVPGFVPEPRTGGRNSSSGVVTILIPFTPFLVPLTFNESGLPTGTNWSVTVGGHLLVGSTAGLNLTLPNASYPFTVALVPGYYVLPGGSVTLTGVPLTRSFQFVPATFELTFVEFGLPNGTQWTVDFGGTRFTVVVPEVSFIVANGSYTFGIPRVSVGYSSSPTNGTVTMRGVPLVVRIGFTPPPAAPLTPPPPPTHTLEYALATLAAILGLLAVAGWLLAAKRRRDPGEPGSGDRAPPADKAPEAGAETPGPDANGDYSEPPP
ncbi:MAG: right-handed parallel beta-helix repeat-containing protein [Thermoplasmata archaeon]|nr:right-handed parallel beta-helix repeat-containing protein [Thermoplasmata archaeon]